MENESEPAQPMSETTSTKTSGEVVDLLAALQKSVAAAKLARSPVAGGTCPECHHQHTPAGCTGPPSPSDIWAGVSPSGCDCDDIVNESEPHDCCGEMRWQRSVCEDCGHQEAWCNTHGTTCGCPTPAEPDATAGEHTCAGGHCKCACHLTPGRKVGHICNPLTPAEPDAGDVEAGERCDGNWSDIHNRVHPSCRVPGVPHPSHVITPVEESAEREPVSQSADVVACVCGHSVDGHGGFVNILGCIDCTCAMRPSDLLDAVRQKAGDDRAERIAQAIERLADEWDAADEHGNPLREGSLGEAADELRARIARETR